MQTEHNIPDEEAQLDMAAMDAASDTPPPAGPDLAPRFYGVALLLLVIILSGVWLISRFTQADRDRDVQGWQEKLNMIAESRTEAVTGWVKDNFKELRALADNPSLQLYLAELQAEKQAAPAPIEASQKTYLRNLLVFTAERAGFSEPATRADNLPANTGKETKSGIAILNKKNEIMVSSLMTPAMKDEAVRIASRAQAGREIMTELRRDDDGVIYVGFSLPVYGIQGDGTAASQIGRVVGIKLVGDNLFGLLKHAGVTEKTLESILLDSRNGMVDYLSPLVDGTAALTKQERVDRNKEKKGFVGQLFANPGSFLLRESDYRDKPVMATSRKIAGTGWILVTKVDKEEAFAESGKLRANMVAIFALIIVVICVTVAAMWWYSQSQRSLMLSLHFRRMAAKSAAQEKLLRTVADNQPDTIYIVGEQQECIFANRKAADDSLMDIRTLPGKSMADLRGPLRADQIRQQCDKALASGEAAYDTQTFHEHGKDKITRSAYVPLEHVAVSSQRDDTRGVLVVEQDISEVVREREERLRIQDQLVATLVNLVDKRDPFSANHSLRVSELAYALAEHLELDEPTRETVRIAGSLMNIGKIVVPAELLTKTSGLSEDEKRAINGSMGMAADLIGDIRFAGPVADTLRQWPEKFDGSGPKGLKGDAILISARIIAVANAFVGMISPRSWRDAMSAEAAGKQLLDHSDSQFDRRVVTALMHHVESQSGKSWLKQLENKKGA